MRITEAQAAAMKMTKDSDGNWTTKEAVEFVESQRAGGFRRVAGRSKASPAQVRSDIIKSAVAMGLSESEALAFYELGRRGR